MSRDEAITALYNNILNRMPDAAGLFGYVRGKMDISDIQAEMLRSSERAALFPQINPTDQTASEVGLPIFIINLERRPDRRKAVESKLNNLGILDYTIEKAVDGAKLTDEEISESYDSKQALELNRSLTRSEVACALSHINVAKKIISEDIDYALVLEDDANLTLAFKQFVADFDAHQQYDFDFLILGGFSSNTFDNCKPKTSQSPHRLIEGRSIVYLDEPEYNIGQVTVHKPHYPSQFLDFVHGAHAYIISNAGAKKLLELNYPVRVEADNVWNYFPGNVKVMFTKPVLSFRQHEDSDLQYERGMLYEDMKTFGHTFQLKYHHPDFGT